MSNIIKKRTERGAIMDIAELLKSVTNSSIVFACKFKDWSETNFSIERTIWNMGDKYQSFNKGDIYLRNNGTKIRVHIFTGESTSHYDVTFGAGSIQHKATNIDVNELLDYTYVNAKELNDSLCEILKRRAGVIVYK